MAVGTGCSVVWTLTPLPYLLESKDNTPYYWFYPSTRGARFRPVWSPRLTHDYTGSLIIIIEKHMVSRVHQCSGDSAEISTLILCPVQWSSGYSFHLPSLSQLKPFAVRPIRILPASRLRDCYHYPFTVWLDRQRLALGWRLITRKPTLCLPKQQWSNIGLPTALGTIVSDVVLLKSITVFVVAM